MRTTWLTSFSFVVCSITVMCGMGDVPLHGEPLDHWEWRNPLPQGNRLNNVVFANGTWLALGDLGTILGSTDGTNWSRCETGVLDPLRDCAYGNGMYVTVGDFGTLLTSTDGVSWVSQYPGTFYSLNGITYGNGQFVAVGEQSTILTSSDGTNWTTQSSGDWDLYDVVFAKGVFVAVGGQQNTASAPEMGVILSSPDGRIWTRRVTTAYSPFFTVAYGDGQFAAYASKYGNGAIWSSGDGTTWTLNPAPGLYIGGCLFHEGGSWLLVPESRSTYADRGNILISSDLSSWVSAVQNTAVIGGIAGDHGLLVASRIDGTFLTSTNGLFWTNPGPEAQDLAFVDLEYLNNSFVGVGGQQLSFSPNGSIWTNTVTVTNTENLRSITYGKGRYVAGGEYRTVWTSTDGVNWTNPAPELSIAPSVGDVFVAFGNNVFVGASGYAGDVLTSPDGLSWTVQQLQTNTPPYIYFRDLTFGNGRFVAVSDSSVATSTDGTNWFFNDTVTGLNAVAAGNGRFVAVGANTATSTDGTNWTTQSSGHLGALYAIAFGGGWFVASGFPAAEYNPGLDPEAPMCVSQDGIHWSRRHSRTAQALTRVAFGNGTFVITGGNGSLLQSDPLVNLEFRLASAPQLLLWGPLNRAYRLESAEALDFPRKWTALATVQATELPTRFNDPNGTNRNSRLYRAVLLP